MSTYSFETDDAFNRKRYAQFIINIIQNCDSFQRADENRSYTVCLDSGYGTGKSVFLKKLENMIEEDFENNGIGVVSYNAWENDFYEDAFTPFLFALLNNPWLDDARKADDAKGTAARAKNAFVKTGKSIAKAFVKYKLGEDAAEIFQSVLDGTEKKIKGLMGDTLSDYTKFKDNISEFNLALESCLVAWNLNKLVIIIDELDRCKPNFAIRTLEIIKHLMNVKNVVFLLALDKCQLGKAVEKVYGYGMDSDGYLCKFFDYIAIMPKPSLNPYITRKYGRLTNNYDRDISITQYIYEVSDTFLLTIRDVDTIMMSYKIMINTFLMNYAAIDPYRLYLVCLALKYKYPVHFIDILVSGQYANKQKKPIPENLAKNEIIQRLISYSDRRIADDSSNYSLINTSDQVVRSKLGLKTLQDLLTHYAKFEHEHGSYQTTKLIEMGLVSIDGMFFIEDLNEWFKHCGITYGMYIHKKLEMFNFGSNGEMEL